jgi:putative endonuclease
MIANKVSESEGRWIVYILQCADMSLYTGITTDLDARLVKYATGKGAKYTRGRGPYEVVLTENYPTKSAALKRELAIKKMDKHKKLLLKNDE